MDFAPYQSSPPEHSRPFSPSSSDAVPSPRGSVDRRSFSPTQAPGRWLGQAQSPPLQHPQPQRGWHGALDGTSSTYAVSVTGRAGVSEFDTSLGIRLDHEACLAYLILPPIGAIILLMTERNSDYVRFHAWQSALIFTVVLVLHLFLSWSAALSWLLFVGDVATIGSLTLRAYRDADTLDRFEVPIFGQMASNFLDDE